MSESLIDERYEYVKNRRSDINEHIETLYKYTTECESVIELGVRNAVSSWAFMKGLGDNGQERKELLSCDLCRTPDIKNLCEASCESNINFEFYKGNDLELDLKNKTYDLLFIDTWHVYGQMKRELDKFGDSINKYIIMHDTTIDGINGESIRLGHNTKEISRRTNMPEEEIRKGILPAIEEFLQEKPEWGIHEKKENNNGLMVLKRKYRNF